MPSVPSPSPRSVRLAALLLLAALPATVLAQDATPTPFPAQPTPVASPDATPAPSTPEGAGGGFSTTPAKPAVPKGFGRPVVAPTFGLSLSTRTVAHRPELEGASFDVWLGARVHAMSTRFTPFVAAGLEIDTRAGSVETEDGVDLEQTESSESWVEIVPEMRMGWALVADPSTDYFNQVFPIVELYGIAGWRIANDRNGHAARLGVGVSAPMAMLLGMACEVPMPAQLELLMDVDSFQTGEREVIFRFGWHF